MIKSINRPKYSRYSGQKGSSDSAELMHLEIETELDALIEEEAEEIEEIGESEDDEMEEEEGKEVKRNKSKNFTGDTELKKTPSASPCGRAAIFSAILRVVEAI